MRKYGWQPDLPDHRDFNVDMLGIVTVPTPPVVDLSPTCSPVEDQGALGSCTANALAGALEYLMKRDKKPFFDVSRLFIYYNERAREGTVSYDSGAMLRDGIKVMAKYGVCSEALWPYIITKFKTKPAPVCYKQGLQYQIQSYARLNTIYDMTTCLANGFPFVFGFSVYESFESQEVAKTGIVNMPSAGEQLLGGHAVLAVGYDKSTQRFLVRNSWGPNFGLNGYFTMPFAYLTDRNLSDDLWVIKVGENM
jgi:C1A family cysteine protease